MNFLKRIEQLLRRAKFLQPSVLAAVKSFSLRREFLRHRDEWLVRSLRSVPNDSPFQHLMAVVDRSRVLWFDIMTQYRAGFSTQVPIQDDTQPAAVTDEVKRLHVASDESTALLAGWVTVHVRDFRNTLLRCLPYISDLSSVSRAMDQCMYFGASLGRLGADFRAILIPIFEQHIESVMTRLWQQV